MHDLEMLRRLVIVDRALASADGGAVRELARELGVSLKTIRRDLDRLHEISPLVYWETARSKKWWQYANRRRRVFSAWTDKLALE